MLNKELKNEVLHMRKIVNHVHLDGSVRPETIYTWLKEEGKDIPLEEVRKMLMVDKDCRNLNEYLEKFDLPCKMLQSEEHIEQATYELFEDLAKQNVIYAEVRFAPSKHQEKGLSYDQIIQAAIRGMEKAKSKYNIGGSLILCVMRGEDNRENRKENLKTILAVKKYLGKGVSAADLAGAEALFPARDYKKIFKYANKIGVPFTIHAGEAAGPESIKEALELGAQRIGHGVRCLEDEKIVNRLLQNEVILEVCPTSNLQTRATGEKHPIEELYRRGLKTTISTDNNTVSNTDILEEYEWILDNTNLTIQDLKQMNINAARGLFGVPLQLKAILISRVHQKEEKTNKIMFYQK